jgi:hypothetical protein
MNTNWKKANEVVCEELGEGALLVDIKTGNRWVLNASAAAMWKLEGAAGSISEFCARLNAETICRLASGTPTISQLGLGAGSRRRPSPRGNSGPG